MLGPLVQQMLHFFLHCHVINTQKGKNLMILKLTGHMTSSEQDSEEVFVL
jgi:hypothetical protein